MDKFVIDETWHNKQCESTYSYESRYCPSGFVHDPEATLKYKFLHFVLDFFWGGVVLFWFVLFLFV